MVDLPKRKRYFTKHFFRAGLQCPTKLYYYAHHYPQDQSIRPFLVHAGHNKYQLKGLLRGQFPDGTQVDASSYSTSFDETRKQLQGSSKVFFDAVFIHRRRVAKIPVLVIDDRQAELHFVQTKVINPRKHHLENHHGQLYKKWRQYIYDAAFQALVVKKIYPDWEIKSFLSLPDKRATAKKSKIYANFSTNKATIAGEDLFHKIDISEYVNGLLVGQKTLPGYSNQFFEETIDQLTEQYFSGEKHPVEIGLKCKNCEFRIQQRSIEKGKASGFNECWNEAGVLPEGSETEPHVFDLIGPGTRKWVEKAIYLQKDILVSDLRDIKAITDSKNAISHKQRQALQIKQAKGQEVPKEIIKPPLFEEINRWQYPLHFLDFEAGNYAVPIRKGCRPYHLVVFQFSCHTLCKNGSLRHHQWIAKDGDPYPSYVLARHLMQVPEIGQGTIIQYSNFERTALKIIRKELENETEHIQQREEMAEWLRTISRRHDSNHKNGPHLADLSRLVKNYYYNRSMADSLSIKDIVQAILTLSAPLKSEYKKGYNGSNFDGMKWWQWDKDRQQAKNSYVLLRNLQPDVKVGRGTEAMVAFGKILEGSLNGSSKKEALHALLQYCELDTLAMVMIYQHWQYLADSK